MKTFLQKLSALARRDGWQAKNAEWVELQPIPTSCYICLGGVSGHMKRTHRAKFLKPIFNQ